MSYRVFWNPDADADYRELEARCDDVSALRLAASQINRRLIHDAADYGESRPDDLRIAFESPLAVLFEVLEDVKTAIVYQVWQIR